MQLQLLIQEYINYQENRQARRPLTITRYSEYLKKRREYLQQKYCCVSVDMNDLEKIDVSDFALTLKSKKRKNKTINGYLAAIKSFLKRCYKQRNYETIKFDQIEFMKGELYTAEILTQTELEELFSMPAIHERQEIIILRNELYLKMLYSTGLRISELSNLETAQINEQQFSVIGK